METFQQLTEAEIAQLSKNLVKLLPNSSAIHNITQLYLDGTFRTIVPTCIFAYDGIIDGENTFIVAKQEKKYYNALTFVLFVPNSEYLTYNHFSALETIIDWSKEISFTAVHFDIWPKLATLLSKHGTPRATEQNIVHYMDNFYAKNITDLDTKQNQSVVVKTLSITEAEKVTKYWKFASEGSVEEIREAIAFVGSVGVFVDEELVSWAFAATDGQIHALFTLENHRGLGYGKLVLRALGRYLARKGQYPTTNVEGSNQASLRLMASSGFKISHPSRWVEYFPPKC